jgi:hypothetical protein
MLYLIGQDPPSAEAASDGFHGHGKIRNARGRHQNLVRHLIRDSSQNLPQSMCCRPNPKAGDEAELTEFVRSRDSGMCNWCVLGSWPQQNIVGFDHDWLYEEVGSGDLSPCQARHRHRRKEMGMGPEVVQRQMYTSTGLGRFRR